MSMAIKQSTQILTTARFTVQAKYKNMMSLLQSSVSQIILFRLCEQPSSIGVQNKVNLKTLGNFTENVIQYCRKAK